MHGDRAALRRRCERAAKAAGDLVLWIKIRDSGEPQFRGTFCFVFSVPIDQ
jgi:hypothetical protein